MAAGNKAVEVTLGIVTSVGGFLEIGSIATAGQAGALFGFQLVWAVVLGGVCVAFLVEQSGRLAAVSGLTIAVAIRERFGANYWFVLLVLLAPVTLLTLAAEIGGVAVALEFATGIAFRWRALPVMLFAWLLLWKGKFSAIEQGVSFLGLVTVCFVIGAFHLGPTGAKSSRAWCLRCRRTTPAVTGSSRSAYSARRLRRTSCSSIRPVR